MRRTIILMAIVLYLVVTFLFILSTIKRKGRFGINLEALSNGVACPRSGCARRSAFRTPRNARQFLWGGRTCEDCGCEFDKWGREVS
jgi:hypothetical protein